MGDSMQELNRDELFYLNHIKKEIGELNITKEYKAALIKCVKKLFDIKQLPNCINIEEFNRKMIAAERDLVFTRYYANENDVLFANPCLIEDDILLQYHSFISNRLK